MYYVTTPTGIGQTSVATPILSTAPAADHARRLLVGQHRVWAQGQKGGWWVRKRGAPGTWQRPQRRVSVPPNIPAPVGTVTSAGMGCGCAGMAGCGCAGLGQTALSNLPGDFGNVLQDLFLNADGSVNAVAVAATAAVGFLIFANWGNTTRRRK